MTALASTMTADLAPTDHAERQYLGLLADIMTTGVAFCRVMMTASWFSVT